MIFVMFYRDFGPPFRSVEFPLFLIFVPCCRTSEAVRGGSLDGAGSGGRALYAQPRGGHIVAEVAETRPAEQLVNELNMLAHNGASGTLRIVSRPGGVFYLKNGYLTYAETFAVPDLGTRLVRSGC